MQSQKLTITKATIRHNRLSIRDAGREFFPDDVFGGSTQDNSGRPVLLRVRGFTVPVETDIPTDADGRPRWFFRKRAWVADFLKRFDLKEGDQVSLIRTGDREYLLDVMPGQLTFIDLFAGIGGIRLAYETAGAQCVFSSEWNKFSAQTYSANFSEVPHGDITAISEHDIPDHDILLGGFPCQPFSIAGVSKKNALGRAHGFDDETQGTLFFDILRILEAKQPRAFMLENVRNLKSHDQGRTYHVIRSSLEKLGYHVQDKIIDGSHVVPQMRKRIFIVGTKPAVKFQFPTTHELEAWKQASTIGEILDDKVDKRYTLTAHLWDYLQKYKEKHSQAGHGFGYGLVQHDSIARTLSARYYKDGSEILVDQGPKKRPRMLTERECARLMGFPESFILPDNVSKMQLYRQFGNSVVVPVVCAIAEKLVTALRDNILISPVRPLFEGMDDG